MVDFNNETIISQSPTDVLKLLILEKLDFTIEALKVLYEYYYKTETTNPWVFKASMQSLFWYINPMLLNSISVGDSINDKPFTQDIYNELKKNIGSSELDENMSALEFMQIYLYHKGLLKIDNRKSYDTSRAESVNLEKGL